MEKATVRGANSYGPWTASVCGCAGRPGKTDAETRRRIAEKATMRGVELVRALDGRRLRVGRAARKKLTRRRGDAEKERGEGDDGGVELVRGSGRPASAGVQGGAET